MIRIVMDWRPLQGVPSLSPNYSWAWTGLTGYRKLMDGCLKYLCSFMTVYLVLTIMKRDICSEKNLGLVQFISLKNCFQKLISIHHCISLFFSPFSINFQLIWAFLKTFMKLNLSVCWHRVAYMTIDSDLSLLCVSHAMCTCTAIFSLLTLIYSEQYYVHGVYVCCE